MSSVGLRDVEKIERFYLNSCTDLSQTLGKYRHQSFPALNVDVNERQLAAISSRISRSRSRRSETNQESESEATLNTNNRAKVAFFKICDSLASVVRREPTVPKNDVPRSRRDSGIGSRHLITAPSMSKQEFIKTLEERIIFPEHNSGAKETLTVLENLEDQLDHKHAKSDSVLAKSVTTTSANDTVVDTQSSSKSTTAISTDDINNRQRDNSRRPKGSSSASKVLVSGILLLVILGFMKNVTSRS